MAKRIPQHKVDEIYAAADIVEVVGEFVQLKKRGSNHFGLSPWSNEKTPSMAVSASKNIFKDFSTGKGGNSVTFLMEAEAMSYVEALKYLAEKYSIQLELEEMTPEQEERVDRRESLYIINEFAASWFNEQLMEEETGRTIALSYFKERGILQKTMEEFQLGWCPDTWDAFSKAAVKKQYNEDYLIETGLAFRSNKTGNLIDRFRGRIMFPIHSHMGKVIGFGGRILTGEKMAKYVNSPESEVYHKSQALYGIHLAKQPLRDKDQCILVEGYMDTIALHQNEIRNVVASSGTALTEDQVKLIKRFTSNVLMIYDADRAGIKAALRGTEVLLKQGLTVKVLLLPDGDDPDSFIQKVGKDAFEQYLKDEALDFLDFKLAELRKELDISQPIDKKIMIESVSDTIGFIPDSVTQSIYVQYAAEKLGIGEDVIREALNKEVLKKAKQNKRHLKSQEDRVQQTQLKEAPKGGVPDFYKLDTIYQEAEILRVLVNYYDEILETEEGEEFRMIDFMMSELQEYGFSDPILEKLKMELFETYARDGKINVHFFINHEDPGIRDVVSYLVALVKFSELISPAWSKFGIRAPGLDYEKWEIIYSAVMHYKLKKVIKLSKENREKIKQHENSDELDNLLRMQIHLDQLKKGLSDTLGIVILE